MSFEIKVKYGDDTKTLQVNNPANTIINQIRKFMPSPANLDFIMVSPADIDQEPMIYKEHGFSRLLEKGKKYELVIDGHEKMATNISGIKMITTLQSP